MERQTCTSQRACPRDQSSTYIQKKSGENYLTVQYEKIVPSCNSHWQQGKGTLYSCDDPDRSPREEFFFGQSNSRCACIQMNEPGEGQEILKEEKVTLHLYSGCQPTASTCLVSDTS